MSRFERFVDRYVIPSLWTTVAVAMLVCVLGMAAITVLAVVDCYHKVIG